MMCDKSDAENLRLEIRMKGRSVIGRATMLDAFGFLVVQYEDGFYCSRASLDEMRYHCAFSKQVPY